MWCIFVAEVRELPLVRHLAKVVSTGIMTMVLMLTKYFHYKLFSQLETNIFSGFQENRNNSKKVKKCTVKKLYEKAYLKDIQILWHWGK